MKAFRQGQILELVARQQVTSQEQLRRLLRGRGVDVTQATLSRDIAELGLVKYAADGAYRRPGADEVAADPETTLRRAVAEYLRRIDRVRELVVIKTDPGRAQPLAYTIDHANLAAVAGTVGGDDTILVIARDARRAKALVRDFEEWARE